MIPPDEATLGDWKLRAAQADADEIKQNGFNHVPSRTVLVHWLIHYYEGFRLSKLEAEHEAISSLVKMARCQHTHRAGGNDYIECHDCGLFWDYRRGSEQWKATADREIVKQLAEIERLRRADGR